MRRSVTLVSIAITTFTLVIVASVVYGYRVSARPETAVQSTVRRAGQSARQISAGSVPTTRISARDAAAIASEFIGRTDAYSVQLTEYNGMQAYMVTFSSGDMVYVSMQGEILGVVPPTFFAASTTPRERGHAGPGSDDDGGGHDAGEDHAVEVEHEAGG